MANNSKEDGDKIKANAETNADEDSNMISNDREKALREFISKLGHKSGGRQHSNTHMNHMNNNNNNNNNSKAISNKGGGRLFCSMSPVLSEGDTLSKRSEIQKYLDPDAQMGIGAVCSFPSLDLGDKELPLPSVGSSSFASDNNSTIASTIPSMRASILELSGLAKSSEPVAVAAKSKYQINANANANAARNCSASEMEKANENAAVLEQAAVRNLASPTTWTRSTVHLASLTMLRSLAQSYVSLVESRVKAWTLLLLRKSLSSGDKNTRHGLLKLLATSHSLHLSSVTTTFHTLSKPTIENTAAAQKDDNKNKDHEETDNLILPLLFEAVMTVSIQDQDLPVKLRCPGIVQGKFSPKTTLLSLVKINLDANSLVSNMVEQARLAVFKAVAVATSFDAISQSPMSTIPQFHTALNLSKSSPKNLRAKVVIAPPTNANNAPPTLSSTTNETLTHSKTPSSSSTTTINRAPNLTISKTRKNRSVTWDHQLGHGNNNNMGHNIKRRKFSEPATLKSSRSFGKPDASFFEANRNATFAEFGRTPMHLFVNGKLAAPSNNMLSMANIRAMKSVGNFSGTMADGSSKGNAVFSAASLSFSQRLQRDLPSVTTATSASSSLLTNKPDNKPALFSFRNKHKSSTFATTQSDNNANVSNQTHVPQPSLPRTLTALEVLLAKTASTNSNIMRNSSSSNNITSKKRSLPPEFSDKRKN